VVQEVAVKKLLAVILFSLLLAILVPYTVIADSVTPVESNLLACDSSGKTIFVYFNTGARILSRSTDFGSTWVTSNIGQGINGNSLVCLAASPNYNIDHTLWAASGTRVFRSTSSGADFSTLPVLSDNGTITSLAAGTAGQVLVGTRTGTNRGGIFLFDGAKWQNQNIGNRDVYSVAFSPHFASDKLIMAVTDNATSIQLETLFIGHSWNDNYTPGYLYSGTLKSASLGMSAFYFDAWNNNQVFVGLNGARAGIEGSGPNLYQVVFSEGTSKINLKLNKDTSDCNVHSVAITETEGAFLAAGLADSNLVKYREGITELGSFADSSIPPEGNSKVALQYAYDPTHDNLTSGYRLYAVTSGAGYGLFLSQDFGNTFSPLLISGVKDLTVTGVASNSISLAWTTPYYTGESGYFDLRCLKGNVVTEDNWTTAIPVETYIYSPAPGENETFTLKGLQPQTTYYFAIKFHRNSAWTFISNCVVGTTLPAIDTEPPLAVTDLAVKQTTANSVTLQWTAPGDPGSGVVEGVYPEDNASNIPVLLTFHWYEEHNNFQLSESFDFSSLIENQTGLDVSNWTVTTPLHYGTTYSWRVGSYYAGEGSSWVTRTFTTLTSHSAYDIRYSKSPINANNWINANQCTGEPQPASAGTKQTFTIANLDANTVYYFALKSGDQIINWSILSNSVSANTADNVPPAQITDLQVVNATINSITLRWTAPGDDGNTGTASQYEIVYTKGWLQSYDQWTSVSNEPTPKASGSIEELIITGLDLGATYRFNIRAADEVPNWSPRSPDVSGRTLAPVRPTTHIPVPVVTPTTPVIITPPPIIIFHNSALPTQNPAPAPTMIGPIFKVTGLSVSNDKVKSGELVQITAIITNAGDQTGDYMAILMVNENAESQRNISALAPGSNSSVVFELSKSEAGTYNLRVGEKSDAVQVVKAVRAWIWILIALFILLVILLILRQVLHWGFKGEKKKSD
jgi:hypothetical protein